MPVRYKDLPTHLRTRMHRSFDTPTLQSLHSASTSTPATTLTNASMSLAYRNHLTDKTQQLLARDLRKAIALALGAQKYHKSGDSITTLLENRKLEPGGWYRREHTYKGRRHAMLGSTTEKQVGEYLIIISPTLFGNTYAKWHNDGTYSANGIGIHLKGTVRIESRAGLIIQFTLKRHWERDATAVGGYSTKRRLSYWMKVSSGGKPQAVLEMAVARGLLTKEGFTPQFQLKNRRLEGTRAGL
jgi:hypothetical protein